MFKFYFIIVFFIASVFCNFNNANNALAQPTELLKTLSKLLSLHNTMIQPQQLNHSIIK